MAPPVEIRMQINWLQKLKKSVLALLYSEVESTKIMTTNIMSDLRNDRLLLLMACSSVEFAKISVMTNVRTIFSSVFIQRHPLLSLAAEKNMGNVSVYCKQKTFNILFNLIGIIQQKLRWVKIALIKSWCFIVGAWIFLLFFKGTVQRKLTWVENRL
jgi:hypothetical protein